MPRRAVQPTAPGGWYVHASEPTRGILLSSGASKPADGSVGFAPGCLFMDSDAAQGSQLYINVGTKASANFDLYTTVDLTLLTATVTELNQMDLDNQDFADASKPLAGFTGGVGTVVKTSTFLQGGIAYNRILIDLTGLGSSTTDLDIIGQGAAAAAYVCKIDYATMGTIFGGQISCLEVPLTGADDIDLYYADEGTGKFDDGIAALTETALVTSGGAWAVTTAPKRFVTIPDGKYVYLTGGEAGTAGTYTAGQFLIELWGTAP